MSISNPVRDTRFPCFIVLARVVIDHEAFMRLVDSRGEFPVEMQTADFMEIFESRGIFGAEIRFCDIVLRETFGVLRGPDGYVDGCVFVVD